MSNPTQLPFRKHFLVTENYRSPSNAPVSSEEDALLENPEAVLGKTLSLTQVRPGPVPIEEFCSRPENLNLKSLCQ